MEEPYLHQKNLPFLIKDKKKKINKIIRLKNIYLKKN